MSSEQVRDLLAKLQQELKTTDLDEETRSLVREFDDDIHGLLAADSDPADTGSVVSLHCVSEKAPRTSASEFSKGPQEQRS